MNTVTSLKWIFQQVWVKKWINKTFFKEQEEVVRSQLDQLFIDSKLLILWPFGPVALVYTVAQLSSDLQALA